jgi:hypothetical protein
LGLGERLSLMPQMKDPKNLFGTLLKTGISSVIEKSERICAA